MGLAWVADTLVDLPDLPEWTSNNKKKRYANDTNISLKELSKLRWPTRHFRALAIRNLQDVKVGVFMLESKFPNGLNQVDQEEIFKVADFLKFLS